MQFDTWEFTTENPKVEVFTGLPTRIKKKIRVRRGLDHSLPAESRSYSSRAFWSGEFARRLPSQPTRFSSPESVPDTPATRRPPKPRAAVWPRARPRAGKPPERDLRSYFADRARQSPKPLRAACLRNNCHTQFFPTHLSGPSGTRTPTLPSPIPGSSQGRERRGNYSRSRHRTTRAPPRPRSAPLRSTPPGEAQGGSCRSRWRETRNSPRDLRGGAPSSLPRRSENPASHRPRRVCWGQKP